MSNRKPKNQAPKSLVQRIEASGLFHRRWYELLTGRTYRDDAQAIEHYLLLGADQKTSPHPLFDPVFYLRFNPDVADTGIEPFTHYVSSGGQEGRPPSPFFRMRQYDFLFRGDYEKCQSRSALGHFVSSNDSTKGLFLLAGFASNDAVMNYFLAELPKGKSPHPVIKGNALADMQGPADKYRRLVDLIDPTIEARQEALHPRFDAHFTRTHGKGRSPNALWEAFDPHEEPWHWFHPLIDPNQFSETDVQDMGDPFKVYIAHQDAVDEQPNSYIDGQGYRSAYGEDFDEGQSVLDHYMQSGHIWHIEPGPEFGQRYYLRKMASHVRPGWPSLADWLHRSRKKGIAPLPATPLLDESQHLTTEEIASSLTNENGLLNEDAEVTVIVPAYGDPRITLRCVHALLRARGKTPFRLLVVDDASPDAAGQVLADAVKNLQGADVVVNSDNLGFLLSCNQAVERTNTPFFVLLNNDTSPTDYWLDRLLEPVMMDDRAAAAGSKLLFPNGLLQEAGGIIWKTGAANYGRGDDPNAPEYRYVREADYVSGAALLVRRTDWDLVEGFSEEFAPAYYEDTDLAMKLRAQGRRVLYAAQSNVVHHEGLTSGTDISAGTKRYQAINAQKFETKWADELSEMGEHGDFSPEVVSRARKGRILFIDADLPTPDKDSGSITAVLVMKSLVAMGYHVTFAAENLHWEGKYASILEGYGVEVLGRPYLNDLDRLIADRGAEFDLFWIARANTAGRFIPIVKGQYPDAKVVFDTVDLHHLRMMREAERSGDMEALGDALSMRTKELSLAGMADATVLVSSYEVDLLRMEIGPFAHLQLPLIYEDAGPRPGIEARRGAAFIGGFRHPPNLDSAEWLAEEIWPAVRDLGCEAQLSIVGSHAPKSVEELAGEGIAIQGFVPDLESFLDRTRFTVAPIRIGAGVKGKVGNSLRLGVPVVGTPMAFEGMGLEDGDGILIGQSSAELAEQILRLNTDDELWKELSARGKAYAERAFGEGAARSKLNRLLTALLGR